MHGTTSEARQRDLFVFAHVDGDAVARRERWLTRGTATTATLQQVQQRMRDVLAQLDRGRAELADVHVEADLLASLRLDELRTRREQQQQQQQVQQQRVSSPPPRGSSARSRGAASAGASTTSNSRVGGGDGLLTSTASDVLTATSQQRHGSHGSLSLPATAASAEAAVRAMDEKRRQRVSAALVALFCAGAAAATLAATSTTAPATPAPAHAVTLVDGNAPLVTTATTLTAVAVNNNNNASNNSNAAATASMTMSAGSDVEVRRPRDVHAVLWDDMLQLRQRRLRAEQQVERLSASLATLLRRFDVLQQAYDVVRYSLTHHNAATTA